MTTVRKLKVQLLTEESFKPYGSLIGAFNREPVFRNVSGSQMWEMDCEIDGTLQLCFSRFAYRPLSFTMMEQHHGITQSFIPMSGPPTVVGVAPPTPRGVVPKPEDVAAFLIDGSTGYIFARNTWHTLDRFPLYPPYAELISITDKETTSDLKASGPGQGGVNLTTTIDFSDIHKVSFEFDMQGIGLG